MGFLSLIPFRAWCAIGAAAVAMCAFMWHGHVADKSIREAVEADRGQWQAQAKETLAQATIEAHKQQTTAALAMLEISHEDANRARVAQADAARARAGNDGLQRAIEALRGGGGAEGQSAGPRGLADAAPDLATALSQCGNEYTEVAEVADRLSNQVTALQAWVMDVAGPVCVAAP
jgi:hypothetical protein